MCGNLMVADMFEDNKDGFWFSCVIILTQTQQEIARLPMPTTSKTSKNRHVHLLQYSGNAKLRANP